MHMYPVIQTDRRDEVQTVALHGTLGQAILHANRLGSDAHWSDAFHFHAVKTPVEVTWAPIEREDHHS